MTATKDAPPSLDQAAENLKSFNEQMIDASKLLGNVYVDSYEKSAESLTAFQEKLAAGSKIAGVESLAGAQIALTRRLVKSQVAGARGLLA